MQDGGKTRLDQLLDWVEAGEEGVIMRLGRVVARMVPPGMDVDRVRGVHAAVRIRAMRPGVTLGGLAIRDLIDAGRW
jgi:antitoxin (DNA-binding transcriptional repressor) of toxin-antitoxin stability system